MLSVSSIIYHTLVSKSVYVTSSMTSTCLLLIGRLQLSLVECFVSLLMNKILKVYFVTFQESKASAKRVLMFIFAILNSICLVFCVSLVTIVRNIMQGHQILYFTVLWRKIVLYRSGKFRKNCPALFQFRLVSLQHLIMDAWVQSQAIPYGICSGKCGIASTLVLPFHYYFTKAIHLLLALYDLSS